MADLTGGLGVTLLWGDGEYTFRLPMGAWRAIDAKCGVGPDEMAARLLPSVLALEAGLNLHQAVERGYVGRWRAQDVREIICQGLLFGHPELGPVKVASLLDTWVDNRPLKDNLAVAFAAVMASRDGLPTVTKAKPVGERKGRPPRKTKVSQTAGSRGRTSTKEADEPA